jgi:thiamine-phosphate pyrophosphorylase
MKAPIPDLSLYCVLDANFCRTPEGMVKTAVAAAEGGATVVQLRAPEWKKGRQLQAALLLKKALAAKNIPLIIDDHVDIALLADADGVHVGQEDIPPREVRKLIGPGKIIGLSIGSMEDLSSVDDSVDYLGIGPVFSTSTKKDARTAIGTETLRKIFAAASLPSVAIGGINLGNIRSVMETGVGGAAVVSAICAKEDPGAAAQELRKAISEVAR